MFKSRKMIKSKKMIQILTLLAVIISLMTGCSSETGNVIEKAGSQQLISEASETSDQAVSQTIRDMAGREVEIPTTIDKVFSVNNNGTILLYTLCPDKLIGWNSLISDVSKSYMESSIADLPMLGILYGNSSKSNPEEVMIHNPDIIFFMDATASEKIVEAANKIQKELLIPVVVIKGNLSNYDKAYAFVGELLGEEERASELIDFYRSSMSQVNEIVASIPDEEKITVYYARETDGLSTETSKSPNAQLISFCGGINVAVSEDSAIKSPIVSIEQVITWNPQVIFTGNSGFVETGTYQEITSSTNWSSIAAVKEGKVYPTPQAPFNWFDRPPSVNRIIGMNFVLNTLYPDYYEGDIVEDVIDFYQLFYHYSMTESEAKTLLNIK